MEKNPSFLKKKYNDLNTSPEVASAANRTAKRTKEILSTKPEARIQNYLNRFTEIITRPDLVKRARGIEAFKQILHKEHIVEPEVATSQYLKRQQIIAREQGHGDVKISSGTIREIEQAVKSIVLGKNTIEAITDFPNEQKQMVEEIIALIEEQKTSLDQWVDYFASPDATYPDWLKYWALRSIVGLSSYDKDEKLFPKRTTNTINPFPDLNREALAYVLDAVDQKAAGTRKSGPRPLTRDDDQFENLLKDENFAKLYAFAIEKITPASAELLASTTGKWVKYAKGSNAMLLVQSLQGHGTGWCTAGESVAASQLSRGDFYVYYSNDEEDQPTIPRAAIRMEDEAIAEVRGIAVNQNLDSYIAPVVQKKMHDFPDGKAYEKKAGDMQHLTVIEKKIKAKKLLTKDDLIFLYEIDSPIEGFGYVKDPRILEIRKSRDPNADTPIVFDCRPEQIAHNQQEVSEDTKAYIGPLFPNIFKQLKHLEHIYTSFPEGKIRQTVVEVRDKTFDQYEAEFEKAGMKLSDNAKHMLKNMPPLPQAHAPEREGVLAKAKSLFAKKEENHNEQIHTVRLTVKELGFPQGTLFKNIYPKAQEFGLDLCPAQVGPERRLHHAAQPMNEREYIAMKTIVDADGSPDVFSVVRDGDVLWLHYDWAKPDYRWHPGDRVLFRLRK